MTKSSVVKSDPFESAVLVLMQFSIRLCVNWISDNNFSWRITGQSNPVWKSIKNRGCVLHYPANAAAIPHGFQASWRGSSIQAQGWRRILSCQSGSVIAACGTSAECCYVRQNVKGKWQSRGKELGGSSLRFYQRLRNTCVEGEKNCTLLAAINYGADSDGVCRQTVFYAGRMSCQSRGGTLPKPWAALTIPMIS